MKVRYVGQVPRRLSMGGGTVLDINVAPGDVFDLDDRWFPALQARGTPVEPAVDPVAEPASDEPPKPLRSVRRRAEPASE